MATIRKRGSSWQAQVRREGFPPLSKSFSTKADAAAWARDKERAIDRAELPTDIRDFKGLTLADLLKRYEQEITPAKRGAAFERSRLRRFMNHPMGSISLHQLTPAVMAHYRDERLRSVKPASVRREMMILRHVLEVAKREWGIPLRENPVRQIKLPADSKARDRRLEEGDAASLLDAMTTPAAAYLRPFVLLLIETGMRRGELLSIQWKDVD
jgi:integrase